MQKLKNIRQIIAIASGKGGVGKSTTAVNIACGLQQIGMRVGILDADIYGPSLPTMLGIHDRPTMNDDKTMQPLIAHGIQSMSIGYLVTEKTPMVWRGPMVSMALQQLLYDTKWDPIDYLIIDLPPGTGDIQLTLAQKIPVNAAIIVTTPQDLALLDAKRAQEMFQKVNVPVLGIIENMSGFVCKNCGHEDDIFGKEGGNKLAAQYDLEVLGTLPLESQIRIDTDSGTPITIAHPEGKPAIIYLDIARKIIQKLPLHPTSSSGNFPSIVIQND